MENTRTARLAAAMSESQETCVRIGELMRGRRLVDLTVGEWDHVLSVTDKHIAACDTAIELTGRGGYGYGPTTRLKWYGYRTRAARRAA